MFCPECRTELPDDVKYCVQCGYDFTRIETPPSKKYTSDTFGTSGTELHQGGESLDGLETTLQEEIGTDSFEPGSFFANRYEILEEGKKGGMGAVYKCWDTKLNKVVALKVIHPRLIESNQAMSRFRQEVAISQELQHPNIVKVFNLEEWEGKEYFTMEWVEGVTLRCLINERKSSRRPFSLEEAKRIISQLADALHHAHKYTIHRDIKPENVLVWDENELKIKLTDFGIAKMFGSSHKTATSIKMGTPYYMAPEQIVDAASADKRADIYSVGVVLFELLTLEMPIAFELPSELNTELPEEIDLILRKALAKKPGDRYPNIQEFKDAVVKVIAEWEQKAEGERIRIEEDLNKRKEAEKQRQQEEELREKEAAEKRTIEEETNKQKEKVACKNTEEPNSVLTSSLAGVELKQENVKEVEREEESLFLGNRVLLADDSVTIQKVVTLIFSDEHIDLTVVGDGVSALKKAEEIKPDLILADIVMPGLNGYELCEKVRQHPSLSDIPVLLLSSTFETCDEERAKRVKADDHIEKPFEAEDLIEKVSKLIRKKRGSNHESSKDKSYLRIQCKSCGKKYKVDKKRLTPEGTRVKCGVCNAVMLIRLRNESIAFWRNSGKAEERKKNEVTERKKKEKFEKKIRKKKIKTLVSNAVVAVFFCCMIAVLAYIYYTDHSNEKKTKEISGEAVGAAVGILLKHSRGIGEDSIESRPSPSADKVKPSELYSSDWEKRINYLLSKAKEQISSQKLTSPEGDNAHETLQKLLRIDPKNRQAREMLDSMRNKYMEWGERAFGRENYSKAKSYFEKALAVSSRYSPAESKLAACDRKLQELAAERVRIEDERKRQAEAQKREREERGKAPAGMVFVKGGCFEMGCGSWAGDCRNNEKPVHEVCVDNIYMDKYEVTQSDFERVMGSNPSRFKGSNNSVERVTWHDANAYCEKVGKRLPTEAEWEYAARSGGKREKYAGTSSDSSLGDYAWYYNNSGKRTHPVGRKKPNGLGLYDMSGNVWEWCSDWHDGDYYGRSPKENPKGSGSGFLRVLRGGTWASNPRDVRTSNRERTSPDYLGGSISVGFRCSKSP